LSPHPAGHKQTSAVFLSRTISLIGPNGAIQHNKLEFLSFTTRLGLNFKQAHLCYFNSLFVTSLRFHQPPEMRNALDKLKLAQLMTTFRRLLVQSEPETPFLADAPTFACTEIVE
jgi:hypothetical protein